MSSPVIVLIGAGASYASGAHSLGERPPLTRQLFAMPPARELLATYSLARMAGARIEREMTNDGTLAFEQALLNLRNSESQHRTQMSLAVGPYLQALLMGYSARLRASVPRYEVLVDELLAIRTQVCFVSLNYDTLLDNVLGGFSPLNGISDYINTPLGWSLIKPHGSVNWFVEQPQHFDPTAPAKDLVLREAPIECAPTNSLALHVVRGVDAATPHGLTSRYPAIALPEGPKDVLVLPPEHRTHLQSILLRNPEIHLLVLGYSALDTEILALLKDGNVRIRRLTIVNASAQAALDVYGKMTAFGIDGIYSDVFDGTYEQWIDGDGLRRWVSEFDGPFPSITSPEDLSRIVNGREIKRELERARPGGDDIMTRPM